MGDGFWQIRRRPRRRRTAVRIDEQAVALIWENDGLAVGQPFNLVVFVAEKGDGWVLIMQCGEENALVGRVSLVEIVRNGR